MAKKDSELSHSLDSKKQTEAYRRTHTPTDIPEKTETPLEKALRLCDERILVKAIQEIMRKDELN